MCAAYGTVRGRRSDQRRRALVARAAAALPDPGFGDGRDTYACSRRKTSRYPLDEAPAAIHKIQQLVGLVTEPGPPRRTTRASPSVLDPPARVLAHTGPGAGRGGRGPASEVSRREAPPADASRRMGRARIEADAPSKPATHRRPRGTDADVASRLATRGMLGCIERIERRFVDSDRAARHGRRPTGCHVGVMSQNRTAVRPGVGSCHAQSPAPAQGGHKN
jgi:hypothetical protein